MPPEKPLHPPERDIDVQVLQVVMPDTARLDDIGEPGRPGTFRQARGRTDHALMLCRGCRRGRRGLPGDDQALAASELLQSAGDELLDPGEAVRVAGLRAQRQHAVPRLQGAPAPVQDERAAIVRRLGAQYLGRRTAAGV